jgi:hypothetical protein
MVVGKHEPKAQAASVPTPFTASEMPVGYSSPAARADSMFSIEPIVANSPIGRMTEKYAAQNPPPNASASAPSTGTGGWKAAPGGVPPAGASPVTQAKQVPRVMATRPPGRPPRKRTRPKYTTRMMASVPSPMIGRA